MRWPACESPPERARLYALALIAWDYVDGVLLRVQNSASGLFSSRSSYIEIDPQAKVGKYRVDFLPTMALRRPDKPECTPGSWWSAMGTSAPRSRPGATAPATVRVKRTTWRSAATPARNCGGMYSSPRARRSRNSTAASTGHRRESEGRPGRPRMDARDLTAKRAGCPGVERLMPPTPARVAYAAQRPVTCCFIQAVTLFENVVAQLSAVTSNVTSLSLTSM